jgi:hypothetical protein
LIGKCHPNQAKDEKLTKLSGTHSRSGKCYPRLDLKLYPKKIKN